MTDRTSVAPLSPTLEQSAADCLAGGGEMGALMRTMDWAATPLGPVEQWPQSLRSAVSICLGSRFPILIWWGPQLVMLYNDAYRPMLGATKHPQAMGQPGRACWPEIWHIIGPMLEDTVMTQGQATWSDDQLLLLDRNNYLEECYFTFSYSPIRDESGGVGGVFCAVTETTERVIGERRLRTLRELAARASDAKAAEEAGKMAVETLANNPADLPFVLLYLLDAGGQHATLAGAAGLTPGTPASSQRINLDTAEVGNRHWPWAEVIRSGRPALITDLLERFGPLPGGIWPDSPQNAFILPIMAPTEAQPIGLLVAGISPRREWDDDYRGFLDLVAGHVATAIAHARAYEAERQRAEALAELDRAKTAFFSNVSHEFRTPLTLMLSPLEEMLERRNGAPVADQTQLEMIHRNGLRLLKLVNTLLDFSRIEAGRMRASYAPTDLGPFTAELASFFCSAIERAGLQLHIDCPSLPQPVYVDPEMWEKIVLNLLSNAFKFTFQGEISVSLQWRHDHVELRVRDTGTGIPAAEIPNLFTRFHRIRGAQARTHEGSGIGLAMVQELVRLHGGHIDVESTVGQGTIFTVTLPAGSTHLPADRIYSQFMPAAPGPQVRPYVEEALRWLPTSDLGLPILDFDPSDDHPTGASGEPPESPRILLADDNADLREYLTRLLAQHYTVIPAADGRAALEVVRAQTPNLVLTDVMMPGMDGLELLQALRADPQTAALPVILLSARAGEEARIEGLEVGADDYLVKPFSARELLTRVRTHLNMAHTRRTAAERERALRAEAETAKANLEKILVGITDHIAVYDREWRYVYVNDAAVATLGLPKEELLGRCIWELFPDAVGNPYYQALHQALAEQRNLVLEHYYAPWDRWFENRIYAAPDGVTVFASDITEQKRVEQALRESEARFRSIFESNMIGIGLWHGDGTVDEANDALLQLLGYSREDLVAGRIRWEKLTPPEYLPLEQRAIEESRTRGICTPYEKEYFRKDGSRIPVIVGGAFFTEEGNHGVFFALDISERKQAEEALRASEERLRLAVEVTGLGIWEIDPDQGKIIWSAQCKAIHGLPVETEITRELARTVIYPADLERLLSAIGDFYAPPRNQELKIQHRIVRPDGTVRWIQVQGRFMGEAKEGQLPQRSFGTMIDITERKQRELSSAFLADIGEEINGLSSPDAIIQAAGEKMRNYFGASWLIFAEVNEPANEVTVIYANNRLGPIEPGGVQLLSDYVSQEFLHEMKAGQVIAINDINTDPRTAGYAEVFKPWGMRAQLLAPFVSNGSLDFIIALQHTSPYTWRADEIELLQELAVRVYLRLQRARAEENLRVSEARLQQMADAMPQLVWIANDDGVISYCNQRANEYAGLIQTPTGNWQWQPVLHEADREPTLQAWRNAVANQQPYAKEHRLRTADGTYRWHLSRAYPVFDKKKRVRTWFGTATDIHDLKEAEAALRASEERFSKAFHASPQPMSITRFDDGAYIDVNESFAQMLGYARKEILGQTSLDTGLWQDARTRQAANEVLRTQGGHRDYEHRFRNRNGEWRELQAAAEIIELDGQQCILNVAMDITARKQVEAELMRAREQAEQTAARIAQLQKITSELTFALTPDRVIEVILRQGGIALDAAAMSVKLLSEDGLWLKAVDWFGNVPPEMRASHRRYPISATTPVAEAVRTGEPVWLVSRQVLIDCYPALAQEMSALDFEAACALPLTLGHQILGGIGIYFTRGVDFNTDEQEFLLTLARQCAQALERARLYEAEQQARVALEERVRERTAELERSNRELDQFAYVASHDLKSPLRGIEHLAGFLLQDVGATLPEASRRHLTLIQARIKRMETLLNDLLDYSRAGRHRYPPEQLDLAALIRDAVELLDPPAGFVVEIEEPIPPLISERVPVELLLRNLIGNAIKHHDRPSEGVVRIQVSDQGDWIEVTVADNGPGIDPAFHERIFEIFQTLKPRDQVEGSGIGLTVVKKLVETRGGAIWVNSAPGEGTSFHFTWPKYPTA
ncbi:MAG: hypothetical protein DCC55_22700 [Chloroflexi bacterium]|nr:MAG: hypothetical protein DCC55_22700 [Chloroflexota bacterium]